MRNIEGRLAKLEDTFGERHRLALDWLICLCRTIQGCDPDARARLQQFTDGPVSRPITQGMHDPARIVLAGPPEPEPDGTANA